MSLNSISKGYQLYSCATLFSFTGMDPASPGICVESWFSKEA